MQMQQQGQNLMQQFTGYTIQNPKPSTASLAKGPEINDRDLINDALTHEKYMTDSINVFVREASYRGLHQDLMAIFNETHQNTRELFNLMFRKGYYKVEAEDQQKLQQTYSQFQNYQSQLPYQQFLMQ